MNPPHRRRLPIAALLLALAGFAGGVALERVGWVPGPRHADPAVEAAYAPFWEAREKIRANFVDRTKTADENLAGGAIAGMTAALGDTGHTTYLPRSVRERFHEGLAGQIEGIGAHVALRDNRPTIVRVLPNSPARSAGLRAGDALLDIDGRSTAGQTLHQVVNRVRGKPGTKVRLLLARAGVKGPVEVFVARQKIDVPDVTWQLLPGEPRAAHLAFGRFTMTSSRQMHAALAELRKRGVGGLVFDLRGNPGGLKEQATAIAAEFLEPDKVVLIQEDVDGLREEVRTGGDGLWRDRPVVVLVDGGTASSGEILAAALQDDGRAPVVGVRTFGTGTVLREFPLSDGSALLLAVSRWLTPRGRPIWHEGVEPDRGCLVTQPPNAVQLLPDPDHPLTPEALKGSSDQQFLAAIDRLRERMKKR